VKNERGLIAKIIRKRLDDKTRNITLDTYESEITDLVGLRVMHLEKSMWITLHATIVDAFEHHETPILHIAESDESDSVRIFKEAGLRVKATSSGYRSIH
jgi:ppGpp synthetase/RelA/SpoT-type nucleotidyltranferase